MSKDNEWEADFDDLKVTYPKLGAREEITEPLLLDDEQERVVKLFIKEKLKQERGRIRQKLREIDLIDYYCKCNDQGHVIAMTREAYDEFIKSLDL